MDAKARRIPGLGLILLFAAGPVLAEENDVAIALRAARQEGLSPEETRLLLAIRACENGRPGREYGVLSVPAPTQEEQAKVAARSIRKSKKRWFAAGKPGTFLGYFAQRWAPKGAENDPKGLNNHWARNVQKFLEQM